MENTRSVRSCCCHSAKFAAGTVPLSPCREPCRGQEVWSRRYQMSLEVTPILPPLWSASEWAPPQPPCHRMTSGLNSNDSSRLKGKRWQETAQMFPKFLVPSIIKVCAFLHKAKIDGPASPRVCPIPWGPNGNRRVNILSTTGERVHWVSSWTLVGKQCPETINSTWAFKAGNLNSQQYFLSGGNYSQFSELTV